MLTGLSIVTYAMIRVVRDSYSNSDDVAVSNLDCERRLEGRKSSHGCLVWSAGVEQRKGDDGCRVVCKLSLYGYRIWMMGLPLPL